MNPTLYNHGFEARNLVQFNVLKKRILQSSKSISIAFAQICNSIHESLNKKNHTIVLLFDPSQAFNSIDNSLLLEKLWRIGIQGFIHDWINFYLKKKQQKMINRK